MNLVDLEAVMLHAVGQGDVAGTQGAVVHSSLLEMRFDNCNAVGFALYEHPGFASAVIYY